MLPAPGKKGLKVINTPAASSAFCGPNWFCPSLWGVTILVPFQSQYAFGWGYAIWCFEKSYAKGRELRGKTLGIIGFGRIGREVAKIGLGCGMKVIYSDSYVETAKVDLEFYDGQQLSFSFESQSMESLLNKVILFPCTFRRKKDTSLVLMKSRWWKMGQVSSMPLMGVLLTK